MARTKPKEPYFVGIRDVAEKSWTQLRDPSYRNAMYKAAYDADVERYGGELTLQQANRILRSRSKVAADESDADSMILDYYGLSDVATARYAEQLPSLRFWFHHVGASGIEYVIGGVPDGICDDYCYEFKSPSGNRTSISDNRQMGVRQAELYSYTFHRPNIKMELVHLQRPGPFPFPASQLKLVQKLPVIYRPASRENALGILDRMDQALAGNPRRILPA